jgi:DNA-binding response OmpR family regulator
MDQALMEPSARAAASHATAGDRRRSQAGQYLHKGLSENGHVVDLAHDGIEGRRLATGGDYDLVLLDVMLPAWTASACWRDARRRAARRRC